MKAQEELRDMYIRGVPAFIIGNEIIEGFDARRIEAALDYKVEKCPHCSQRSRIPKSKGKIRIECPKCGKKFETTT